MADLTRDRGGTHHASAADQGDRVDFRGLADASEGEGPNFGLRYFNP